MGQIITMDVWIILILILSFFSFIEIQLFIWIYFVRNHFPWLITKKDKNPSLSKKELEKFIPNGYDSEIGWIKEPNTFRKEHGKHDEFLDEKNVKVTWIY
jgi:hypothetical protein